MRTTMRFGKRPPSPPAFDAERLSEAKGALEDSKRSYTDAIDRATTAVQTGDWLRQIRIRNNIGPSFGLVYERRH
jgi:hypothetical protein